MLKVAYPIKTELVRADTGPFIYKKIYIMQEVDDDLKTAARYGKKIVIWVVILCFIIGGIAWLLNRADSTVDTAVIRYEEFQTLYNTCDKLNTDLKNMREMPDNDKSFEQFSKAQRINAIKTNLNRWVNDYNAKSKMWNHSMWKSKTLPCQLSVDDFSSYAEPVKKKEQN